MVSFPLLTGSRPELGYVLRKPGSRSVRITRALATPQEKSETRRTRVAAQIKSRRERERLFGQSLFSDPAWDILLALYEAHLRSATMSVAEVCIASAAPANVALRWISALEQQGLVYRKVPRMSSSVLQVELSKGGADLMDEHFGTSA